MDNNWTELTQVRDRANRIKEKTGSFLKQIEQAFSDSLYSRGSELIIQDDDLMTASLLTPVSECRIKFKWKKPESPEKILEGTLVLEEKKQDKYDKVHWNPIFSIQIPLNGHPYLVEDGEQVGWDVGDTPVDPSDIAYAASIHLVYHAVHSA